MVFICYSFSHIFSRMFGLLISIQRSPKTFIPIGSVYRMNCRGPQLFEEDWLWHSCVIFFFFFVFSLCVCMCVCVLCLTRMLAERHVCTPCLSLRTFFKPLRWSLTTFKEICASWGKTSMVLSTTFQTLQTLALRVVCLAVPLPTNYVRSNIVVVCFVFFLGNVRRNTFHNPRMHPQARREAPPPNLTSYGYV